MEDSGLSTFVLDTLLIPLLVLIFVLLWIRQYLRFKDLPPGPRGWPLVGSLFELGYKPYETLENMSKKYGPVFSIKLGSQQAIVLNDYKSVRETFVDQGDIYSGRPPIYFFDRGLKNEDITGAMGPVWREQRTFMIQNIKSFGFGKSSSEELIMESVQMVIDDFDASKGAPLSFQYIFFLPILNVIWKFAANHSLPKNSEIGKRLCDMVNYNFDGMFNQLVNFIPLLRFVPGGFGIWRQLRECNNLLTFLVDEIKEHQKRFVPGQHEDFIDVFLQEIHDKRDSPQAGKPPYNVNHLAGTLYDLFQAGSDTSSTTITWGLLILAIHPELQRKVQMELDSVVGRGRQPCFSDASKLPYLEATIQEIHRYVSLVPLSVYHSTTRNTIFRGYKIPKGMTVIQNIYAVHRDTKCWKDPDQFRPERFLDENNKVIKPPYQMPFSVGPRICPGEPMVKMVLQLFFSCLLHKYNFSLPPGHDTPSLEPVVRITLSPQPFSLCVTRR